MADPGDSSPMKYVEEAVNFVKKPRGEDFVDMLNCRITSGALLTFAVLLFARDYVGNPIQCWGNAEWKKGWVQYSHDYCLVENTYYVPMDQKGVPHEREQLMRDQEINYYQWVPFILIAQGLLFMAPLVLWKSFDVLLSGIPVQAILAMAKEATHSQEGLDRNNRIAICRDFNRALVNKFGEGNNSSLKRFRRMFSQRSLAFIYCLTKLLFIVNSTVQFYLLGRFLGKSSHLWGYSTLDALARGESWIDTGLFPRVTMCDLQVRQGGGGHIQKYTVQCVLNGNMVNEKIFIFLWWWLIILNTLTVVNLVQWVGALLSRESRYQSFKGLLKKSADFLFPIPFLTQCQMEDKEWLEDVPDMDEWDEEVKYEEEEEVKKEEEEEEVEEPKGKLEVEGGQKQEEEDGGDGISAGASSTKTMPIGTQEEEPVESDEEAESEEQKQQENEGAAQSSDEGDIVAKNDAEGSGETRRKKKLTITITRTFTHTKKTKEQRQGERMVQLKEKFERKRGSYQRQFFDYLGTDGILMLQLMKINSGEMVTSCVLGEMFKKFKPAPKKFWDKHERFMPGEEEKKDLPV